MKSTLSSILCVVLCVLLAVSAAALGAYRGWSQEREAALNAHLYDDDFAARLEERAMDAANLFVVAARHLHADDPALTGLMKARQTLMQPDADVARKIQADADLSALAQELALRLPELPSVQASERDQAYTISLTRLLMEQTTLRADYDLRAREFNDRLAASLTGRLAILLGVEPIGQ